MYLKLENENKLIQSALNILNIQELWDPKHKKKTVKKCFFVVVGTLNIILLEK